MSNTTSTDSTTPAPIVEGTWQHTLNQSAKKAASGEKAKIAAGILLWDGAKEGINDWLGKSDEDTAAEQFQAEVTASLGQKRRGDASKIKTVALAVKKNGLVLDTHANLGAAYKEAQRLTKVAPAQAEEDVAADEAVQAIVAPKTTGTAEGAALLVLSKGVDEAVRLLLDALGATNEAAHRSFLRAVSQEIAGRKPKPEPKVVKASEKKGATTVVAGEKAVVGDGAAKAKPVKATKAKPVKKAAPAKAAPVQEDVTPVEPEHDDLDDLFDEIDSESTEVEAPVETPAAAPVKKAKPVVVRRG